MKRAAADIEYFSRNDVDILVSLIIKRNKIVNEKDVADLLPVAVDGYGFIQGGGDAEPGHPALIFDTELMITVYTGLSHDDRPEAINPIVITAVLVGGPFRATVGGMEIQRPCLGNPFRVIQIGVTTGDLGDLEIFHTAIDLVCRCIDDHGFFIEMTSRFQKVEGAVGIDLEVFPGIADGGCHGNLGGKMDDQFERAMLSKDLGNFGIVAYVAPDQAAGMMRRQPVDILLGSRPGKIVEDDHLVPLAAKIGRAIYADESRPARDEYLHE